MQSKIEHLMSNFSSLIGSPRFSADTSMFQALDHPVVVTEKNNDICRQCPEANECRAKMDIFIPSLGRLVFDDEYTGNIDSLIGILSDIAGLIKDYKAFYKQSESYEFYRQLTKKVIDLNPHALSILDNEGKLIHQNIIAQNEGWSAESKNNTVTFPIFRGKRNLGKILFSQSQSFSAQYAMSVSTNRDLAFHYILGVDPSITNCIDVAKQVAATNSTILLLGESGTGKEVFANAIHKGSQRSNEAFIVVNCAAIPENLLESELFGYVEGAFTGAKRGGKTGKIVAAEKGTLFLDEIGDLPLSLQPKLLRVLQDRKVEPLGSLKSKNIDVRFICATNKNIEELIKQKLFREDLHYRINAFPIHVPPLRTRTKDIRILLDYNIKKYCILNEKPFKYVHPDLIEHLAGYEWKGNVRELENVVEYAVTMCNEDCITLDDMPIYLKKALSDKNTTARNNARPVFHSTPKPLLQSTRSVSFEDDSIMTELINKHGFTTEGKKRIAKELDISLATLYRRIKKIKEIEDQR